MALELWNYLDEMGEFRVSGSRIDEIKSSIVNDAIRMNIPCKKAASSKAHLDDILQLSGALGRWDASNKIYENIDKFEQPKSKLKVKAVKRIGNDLAYLIGVIAGDGHITKKGYQIAIAFGKNEPEYIETVRRLIRKELGKKPLTAELERGFAVFIQSKIIHTFFVKVLGMNTGKRTDSSVPDAIWMDDDLMRCFIAGFFDTDGSIFTKKGRNTPYVNMAQKYPGILDEISEFLAGHSIICFKSVNKRTGVHTISIYKKSSIFGFCRLIKSRHPNKLERMNIFCPQLGPHNIMGKV